MNKEVGTVELLTSFARSPDEKTARAATKALTSTPDLGPFQKELKEAVDDLITEGAGEEFKAFVNHYMAALEEDLQIEDTPRGENRSQTARIKDETGPWIQGFICYNLCLYIKAFGLQDVKKCRVCGKVFAHKGQYAVYCSDQCKSKKDVAKPSRETI